MTDAAWKLDESDGELLIHTEVTGRAAKLGHRLTIVMNSWRATVHWRAGSPVAVHASVEVESLEVRRGEGGVTPLSGPEKMLVRANALKALDAGRFPQIDFRCDDVTRTGEGYRLAGALEIHGTSRHRELVLSTDDLDDFWGMSAQTRLRQTEFGVKPYALLMGSLKVADEVTVAFSATRAKDG